MRAILTLAPPTQIRDVGRWTYILGEFFVVFALLLSTAVWVLNSTGPYDAGINGAGVAGLVVVAMVLVITCWHLAMTFGWLPWLYLADRDGAARVGTFRGLFFRRGLTIAAADEVTVRVDPSVQWPFSSYSGAWTFTRWVVATPAHTRTFRTVGRADARNTEALRVALAAVARDVTLSVTGTPDLGATR